MDADARDAKGRWAIAGGVILVVLAVTAALLAGFATHGRSSSTGHAAPPHPSTRRSPDVRSTSTLARSVSLDSVYEMPRTDDPLVSARAYVTALLTYDTARQTLAGRRAALLAWTPKDGFFTDAAPMLDDFLGDPDTWQAAKRVHQSETVVIDRVWIPESQKKLMAALPAKVEASRWPYVVTAQVIREVRGDPGTNTDQPLTLSVIVSCPPKQHCVAFAPGRSAVLN